MAKIFLTYRRADASGYSRSVYDRLTLRFGKDNVFMDVATLAPAVDFTRAIDRTLSTCDAAVVLIGPGWVDAHYRGKRRLDDPDDLVRAEVATALKRDIVVVPVLVGGARMPTTDELPDDLRDLSRLHALELSDSRFEYDANRLLDTISSRLGGTMSRSTANPERRWPWIAGSITAMTLVLTVAVGRLCNREPADITDVTKREPILTPDRSLENPTEGVDPPKQPIQLATTDHPSERPPQCATGWYVQTASGIQVKNHDYGATAGALEARPNPDLSRACFIEFQTANESPESFGALVPRHDQAAAVGLLSRQFNGKNVPKPRWVQQVPAMHRRVFWVDQKGMPRYDWEGAGP